MKSDFKESKVGDLVKANIKYAHVFKNYNIDFCCGGGITVERACLKSNVDVKEIEKALGLVNDQGDPADNFDQWNSGKLCDYIVNTHHLYVTRAIPMIQSYINKVSAVHGHAAPELYRISEIFNEVDAELTAHMNKEEQVLFPYIKNSEAAATSNIPSPRPPFGSVKNPIRMMESEHETAGALMKQIAQLSNQYVMPEWGCNTFKALYDKLNEFEQDLHIHIHLENNILFPKAIAMEEEINRLYS